MLKLSKGDEGENLIKPEIFNCYTAGNSVTDVVKQQQNNELVTTCATGSISKKQREPVIQVKTGANVAVL